MKTRAIVLKSFHYGEDSLIIDMFTEDSGRMSFISRMGKSKKAKVKKQLFSPLSLLEIECDVRQKAQLHRLKDARIAAPFTSIPFDPYKLSISLFLAEFLQYALRGEQKDESLFVYIFNSMRWLDACTRSFANFHIVFLMHLSRFLGFYPNLSGKRYGDYFDLRGACFCSLRPSHPYYLLPKDASVMELLMRLNYQTMHLFAMNRAERNHCIEVIIAYYKLHLPDFPDMKSLDVLGQLFS